MQYPDNTLRMCSMFLTRIHSYFIHILSIDSIDNCNDMYSVLSSFFTIRKENSKNNNNASTREEDKRESFLFLSNFSIFFSSISKLSCRVSYAEYSRPSFTVLHSCS